MALKNDGFCRAALKYLGCTELASLSVEEQRTRAYILSVAALLGKDVYNFGELLAHPGWKKVTPFHVSDSFYAFVLNCDKGTPFQPTAK